MKKITAFVGSARKKHTYNSVQHFLASLEALGGIESEIVVLSDYDVKTCRGCRVCFDRGEEFCPSRNDDRDALIEKMMKSDGVVFATPNYSFQVSGIMKVFLDRLGFVFHRPCFFGRAFTNIVVQGIYGGQKIVKYLDFVGNGLGFNIVHGSCVRSLEPITEKQQRNNHAVLDAHARRFHAAIRRPVYPPPTFVNVMAFRMSRTSMKLMLPENSRDYTHYRDHGWFEAAYFYPARLNLLKRVAGSVSDRMAARMAASR